MTNLLIVFGSTHAIGVPLLIEVLLQVKRLLDRFVDPGLGVQKVVVEIFV